MSRAWTCAFAASTAVLGAMLWSARRHRSPTLRMDCHAPIEGLIPSLAGLTLSTAIPGNALELLENGRYFDVLLDRIGRAQRTIHLETFLWKQGRLARRLSAALAGRARAGVRVRVMLDASGGRRIAREDLRCMRDAGCTVHFFHKLSPWTLGVLTDRTHRKIVVIDGREAFVGGHCITDDWLGDAEDGVHFADASVHVRGPVVHAIQSAFSENWVGETGELIVGDDVFPPLAPAGDALVHVAFVKPESSAPAVKILHHTVIGMARERLWIQNPYFIPEPEAIDAFGQAVRRGVDVRVLMPSESGSDNPVVQHAVHRNFQKMLDCGVRLFEYPHTLLHQKVLTVDGRWCAIGSTNFDDRSFDTNDEITLGVLHRPLVAQLDAMFERYAARALEIDPARWRRRGPLERARDQVVYTVNELL